MTPIDIEMKEFRRARFGGYNIDHVNEFLDEIIRAFEDMEREKNELENKNKNLQENIDYYKTMEETLKNTMILAEKTAEETKLVANEKAEQIILEGTLKSDQMIENARQEAYAIKQNIEDLKKQYSSAKIQIKQMLQTQLEILETQNIATSELAAIETETKDEEQYYTREYKIINEEDAI